MFAHEPDQHPDRAVATGSARAKDVGDVAVMLGALSIVAFWSFGIGVLLGLGAVVTAVVARRRALAAHRPVTVETFLGAACGIAGMGAGLIFLALV